MGYAPRTTLGTIGAVQEPELFWDGGREGGFHWNPLFPFIFYFPYPYPFSISLFIDITEVGGRVAANGASFLEGPLTTS
jgi:hypothetical protein